MARPDKVAKVEEVRQDLVGASATLLTHYRGLSVADMAQLRSRLRESNAHLRIVKNTLTKRAAEAAGIDGLADLLVGPTGLVFCADDPVGPAKAIKAFQKDHPGLVLRGGYLDGELLDDAEALRLADLESREELLARLAGLMQGALSGTARLLQAATEKQARLMAALVEAGGAEAKGFATGSATTAEVAASADDADDADETPAVTATDPAETPGADDEPAADAPPAAQEAEPDLADEATETTKPDAEA